MQRSRSLHSTLSRGMRCSSSRRLAVLFQILLLLSVSPTRASPEQRRHHSHMNGGSTFRERRDSLRGAVFRRRTTDPQDEYDPRTAADRSVSRSQTKDLQQQQQQQPFSVDDEMHRVQRHRYHDPMIHSPTSSPTESIHQDDLFPDLSEHFYDYESDDESNDDSRLDSFFPRHPHDHHDSSSSDPREGSGSRSLAPSSQRTPVVYRYYSRNRSRAAASGSIPFILLGPNVDHWKVAGQELAARGFNVMAVERVREQGESTGKQQQQQQPPIMQYTAGPDEAADLVIELLDALRWNKVVLVGCDSEAALAVRAALRLAPGRVVGLVLCGNLETVDDFVASVYPQQNRRLPGALAVDRFLHSNLRCPFQVVWDGDLPPGPYSVSGIDPTSPEPLLASIAQHRSVVLGGGIAPHRRRPELFSWVLTRFVEENIAPSTAPLTNAGRSRTRGGQQAARQQEKKSTDQPKNFLLFSLSEFLSPGSLVVWGRVAATTLCYGIMMKIVFFQYASVRGGLFSIKAGFDAVASLRRLVFGSITSFFGGLGSLPFSFRRGKSLVGSAMTVPSKEPSDTSEDESEKSDDLIDAEPETNMEDDDDKADEQIPDFKPFFFLDHVIA